MAELYPYQKPILNGFKPGEITIMMAGRQMGIAAFGQALQRLMDDIMLRPVEDLVLSEGSVYGSRYYCIEPVGGNWREMEDWCINTFGSSTGSIWAEEMLKQSPKPKERWYGNNRKFWFQEEKDRDWFILKWR
jgi:hypothetical protein